MKYTNTQHISLFKQFLLNSLLVLFVAGMCYYFSDLINNKIVALIFLMTVSLSAMVFNIWPIRRVRFRTPTIPRKPKALFRFLPIR